MSYNTWLYSICKWPEGLCSNWNHLSNDQSSLSALQKALTRSGMEMRSALSQPSGLRSQRLQGMLANGKEREDSNNIAEVEVGCGV